MSLPTASAGANPIPRARVACFEVLEWQRQYLSERLPECELIFLPVPLNETTAERAIDAEVVSVFIRSRVSAEVIRSLPNVRLVATRSTGFDHVDLAACRQRGIAVATVPRYGENTVAEHTFGLLMSLTRHIHKAYMRTARNDFSLVGLEGIDLMGRTIGVVGAGRIGLHVIRIAKGFAMRVLAYDSQPQPLIAEVLGFEYLPLDGLLKTADIVTLHVPLIPATHHLMNRESFATMKRGSYLVNTSRGGVVDTEALIWALDEGILAGAGLDVFEGEELVNEESELLVSGAEEKLRMILRQHNLTRRENVVMTPHMAFYSREAEERILQTTIDNVRSFLAGSPTNLVSPTG